METSGIVISRRPKMRESIEKAPGPRQSMAALMRIPNATWSFTQSALGDGALNHESVSTVKTKPAKTLATGVKYPMSSKAPVAIPIIPIARVGHPDWFQLNRQKYAWPIRIRAIAQRNRSRPTPGQAPGNVEKILCNGRLCWIALPYCRSCAQPVAYVRKCRKGSPDSTVLK